MKNQNELDLSLEQIIASVGRELLGNLIIGLAGGILAIFYDKKEKITLGRLLLFLLSGAFASVFIAPGFLDFFDIDSEKVKTALNFFVSFLSMYIFALFILISEIILKNPSIVLKRIGIYVNEKKNTENRDKQE